MAGLGGRRDALVGLQRALPRVDGLSAWAAAACIIGLATLLKFVLDEFAGGPLPPYITYYPAVVLSALAGGLRIGLVTAATTIVLAWYIWLPNPLSFAVTGAATALTIGIYAANSFMLATVVGFARLSLDRLAANEAQRARNAAESVHRIKNLIAVVQALAVKIAREVKTPEEFREVFARRLEALAIAQNVLVREDWNDVSLKEVIQGTLAPFLPNPGLKVDGGPEVVVPAQHVNGLSLALYELSTNAMKYGALANGEGPVVLSWRCADGKCELEWREGRRAAAPVESSGFGSVLIKTALSNAPDTHVEYEFTPTEVVAVFRWPAPSA